MTLRRLLAVVATLLVLPVNADEFVDRADANGDGYVSLYELRAAYYADMEFNRRIEQSFADYDTDGDGLISEAERRAQAVAAAETTPAAGTGATAPGGTEVSPAAGTAPTPASGEIAVTPATRTAPAAISGETAVSPATGTAPAPAAGSVSEPAAETLATTAAEAAQTPTAGSSAPAAAASTRSAETVSVGTSGLDMDADRSGSSPEVAPATTAADGVLPDRSGLSRTELWIRQIDTDNSGGASISELMASGDGSQWFHDNDFASADKDGDGDLGPDELEVLIQSMERRQRR